ncbi:winged helix-turn-helix transcriptional regulator [Lactobacillus ultunensis]|uniref:Transcriptional regulator, HxlR family n=1 Tax=Lactobacillus ultunensis DSM 16047 TaxID=525365 RepID=C2EKS7_9LACO|nr:helix-turn-helix domain-containing protein [Lactobacillus ultunensis]EEJ72874.1 transcriptional regulator, HxlR family [Lactobacillus ultunensis DSM 16047]KRL83064.1 transcriptional regulator [Lactobacillus ultunensis DSM 16047]
MQEVKEKKETVPCKPEDYELCCHFIKAFQIIGKKWNGLIISSLCDTQDMRFKDLARCIEACSDRVLVERLKELEQEQIVKRSVDQDTGIISYSLTQKGAELKPVFDQVHHWADKWA